MRILKIVALVGVILDMLLTHLGILNFGVNYEMNAVVRYIYSKNLWDYLIFFAIGYYSTIYLILDILNFTSKKFPQISTIMKIISVLVALIPFVGFGGWTYFFLTFKPR